MQTELSMNPGVM